MGMSEERRRPPEAEREVRFGRFRLHPSRGLTRGLRDVRVTPKSLAVLHLLVERSGEIVSKEALFRCVWPDTAVSDAALTSCIQELRGALGDNARQPRFIETVHRRGYRFVAPIHSPVLTAVPPLQRIRRPHQDTPVVGRRAVLDAPIEARWQRACPGGVRTGRAPSCAFRATPICKSSIPPTSTPRRR